MEGLASFLLEYQTVQLIRVRSPSLAVTHHTLRLATLVYVAVSVFYLNHGVQSASVRSHFANESQ